MNRILVSIGLLVLISILAGCGGTESADLIPERRPGSEGAEGFCRRDDEGNLVVRVRNQSNKDVLITTTTTVTFSGGPEMPKTTPAMPGGSFADVTFEIPSGSFDPDAEFTIKVDANDDVTESNEGNNTAKGICIG